MQLSKPSASPTIQTDDPARLQRRVLLVIMGGLLVWGVIHAVGAVRLNENPWRGVVVLACCAGFIGFWLLLLRSRQPRKPEDK